MKDSRMVTIEIAAQDKPVKEAILGNIEAQKFAIAKTSGDHRDCLKDTLTILKGIARGLGVTDESCR